MNWIIHFLVYLGNFTHFKETVEPSILTHWFDLSAIAKVSIPEFCIQWGLMQAQRLPQCQHSVQKVWIPPSIGNRLPIWSSPFFFLHYCPIEILDKHKGKLMRQGLFFIFRRIKNNVACFFCKQHFYKQELAVT